jgi:predicted phosphohydrolase
MKIQYCSDLHLEFPENRKFIARNPLKPTGDVLVLAGDIVTFRDLEKVNGFFDFVSDHYSCVYWVPGNHEYYGSDIAVKPDPLFENIRSNVYLVNNQAIEHGGIRFVFSTMWSRIGLLLEQGIQRGIADFSAITDNGEKFTTRRFNGLHQRSLAFLRNSLLSVVDKPTVVVTHHVPTLMNYPAVYKDSLLTDAFAVELFEFIDATNSACWIYGHHHVNTSGFKIGATDMLTNQLGYVHHHKHGLFRREATVDIAPIIRPLAKSSFK